jgi:hypothetical protein
MFDGVSLITPRRRNLLKNTNTILFLSFSKDVLKKITHYMVHTNCKLQMAAVLCVHNLSLAEESGSAGDNHISSIS